MCLAVPGKIIGLDGAKGKALVRGNTLDVELGIVQADIGDYVLIHAGCAIATLPEDEALELDALFKMVDAYGE